MSEPDDDDGEVTVNAPAAVSDNCEGKELDDDAVPSPPEELESPAPAPAPAAVIAAQQEQRSSSRLSGTTTTTTIAEPPRWRFVNSAKKSLGYSSTAAGTVVQGLSAQELAVRYVAPKDTEQPRLHEEEEAGIGRVSVPSFLENGTLSSSKSSWSSSAVVTHPKTSVDVVSTKPTISAHHERQQDSQEQQLARLQELKDETQKMQNEHTLLRLAILETERRKETLEKETREVREDKERLMREKAEVEEAAVVVPAQAAPTETTLVSTVAGGGHGVAGNDNDVATSDDKQGKRKSWGMYALIAILLCVVAALLGVMLMGNNGDSNNGNVDGGESRLRGPPGVGEPAIEPKPSPSVTQPPTVATQPPTVATLEPTDASTEVSIADPADANKPGERMLNCPSDSKQFDITVQVGLTPSAITWILLDRCTLRTFFKCTGCYQTSPPNYPVSFAGCLPSYNNATGEGHEYVLRIFGSFEYVFRVEDEIKFSSVEGV
eukprot:CAMPEP_0196133454 /NCGR_PEP_ID=MMETSP0910-20130528/2674_1 /TAXON_ID=49265 /ORGANISM="Thalassiosira rotula, Strain GSO102" /LENGTH=490 /DNA_ID=CAMNT_0041393183 /DNA_START=143 /DNA_END=1611 /DNA_ORIENTATION=-